MPTYEYRCTKCGHEFEQYQPITAKPLSRCPKCKGRVKRLIGTGGGILFKGTGFYQTDYRSDGYKKKAKEDSKSAEPAGGSKGDGDSGGKKSAAPAAPAEKKSDAKVRKSKGTGTE